MGINKEYEMTAKRIQEYAGTQKHLNEIHELVLQVEKVCSEACEELEEELDMMKKSK